jgi:hypothetical protein
VSDPGQSNADAAKARKALKRLESERDSLKAKLDQIAEANKTEAEKAIEKARKEGAAEAESRLQAELESERRERAIERAVIGAGLNPDFAHIVKAKLGDVETTDIDAAVGAIIEGAEWAKPAPKPGQPGAPSGPVPGSDYPRGGKWDRAQIQELALKPEVYAKYREQIEAAQREAWKRGESL